MNHQRLISIIALALGICTPPAVIAALPSPGASSHAAEYHVAPGAAGASDNNPGTLARPWRTIARAAAAARSGDTVFIHTGVYTEDVTVKNSGTADSPITFKAYGDDEVNLEGAETVPPARWQRVPGAKSIYALPLEQDPGLVVVDGKPVFPKVVEVHKEYPRTYKPGTLTDVDRDRYQFDDAAKRLLLNLGGAPAGHVIQAPVRQSAFNLSAHCILAGIRARHFIGAAINAGGDGDIVEDCLVTDSGSGIEIGGWNRSGVIVRRSTVIGVQSNGIGMVDRPTQCLVEDNLIVRASLNAAHTDEWAGGIKMNSASDTVFANNVVLECGNPDTDGGVDGPALWGDIDIGRILYLGNTAANNKEAGLYIEFAMDDTRAYFNTSFRNGHGITCRASARGVFMRNVVLESASSGLAVWAAEAPFDTTDNVFSHNLIRGCSPSLNFQTEQPEFSDYNTYWPQKNADFADGQGGKAYKTLDDWVKATSHDDHSKVEDVQPADFGLDTVTFRVPDARDPSQVLMMVGNGGCEYEDPAGQDLLPYFWRPGSGDGVDHVFEYAYVSGQEGGTSSQGYPGAGGTIAMQSDSPTDPTRPKMAHSGLRYLEIDGQKPAEMCKAGLGFWSPSLPARPGDTYDISFFVRGVNLKRGPGDVDSAPGAPAGTALADYVEFTDTTGQHRQRVALPGADPAGKPLSGTFGWTRLAGAVKALAGARRMRLFLGVLPGTGQLLLDDIVIKVR